MPDIARAPEARPARYLTTNPCTACGICVVPPGGAFGPLCEPARVPRPRPYMGIRFTSDGFDCALPVSIDSHTHCAYGCLYCFSDNLMQHRSQTTKPIGQTPLRQIELLFDGGLGRQGDQMRRALKYDAKVNGFPCPVQLGAINDPGDHIERQQGWLLRYIDLAIKYRQPTRISTKGTVYLLPDYLDAFARQPDIFWVAFSIISPDDELMARVDRRAPVPTDRLRAMAALSKIGVRTSLRLRPMLPGLSDSTPRYPLAYRTLIARAAEAGATAISTEVAFVPKTMPADLRDRWVRLGKIVGRDLIKTYGAFGPMQSCTRPPAAWTEEIMHRVVDAAHEFGMTVGVSDPVWKQLNDTGCCCGILPDDPVFGNWQRESATNRLLEARDTGRLLGPDDIIAPWAHDASLSGIVNTGAGPAANYLGRHGVWSDHLRGVWNDLAKERSPLNYFQGALLPATRDAEGNVLYRYEGLKRTHRPAPGWRFGDG